MPKDFDRERLSRGIGILSAYLQRSGDSIDEDTMRAMFGGGFVSDEEAMIGLLDALVAAELVMYTYYSRTDQRPIDVLREVALHNEIKSQE